PRRVKMPVASGTWLKSDASHTVVVEAVCHDQTFKPHGSGKIVIGNEGAFGKNGVIGRARCPAFRWSTAVAGNSPCCQDDEFERFFHKYKNLAVSLQLSAVSRPTLRLFIGRWCAGFLIAECSWLFHK